MVDDDYFEDPAPVVQPDPDDNVDDLMNLIEIRLKIIKRANVSGGGEQTADVKQAITELVSLRYRMQIAKDKLAVSEESEGAQYGDTVQASPTQPHPSRIPACFSGRERFPLAASQRGCLLVPSYLTPAIGCR